MCVLYIYVSEKWNKSDRWRVRGSARAIGERDWVKFERKVCCKVSGAKSFPFWVNKFIGVRIVLCAIQISCIRVLVNKKNIFTLMFKSFNLTTKQDSRGWIFQVFLKSSQVEMWSFNKAWLIRRRSINSWWTRHKEEA